MSDIDIERLREGLFILDKLKFGPPSMSGHQSYGGRLDHDQRSAIYEVEKLITSLLDLADEGGELWIEKPNDHDFGADDFCSVCDTHRKSGMKRCARSRVRVWPKEEEVTPPPDGAAVCACGEWEMRPDAFPACPNCGRVWPPKEAN